MCDGFKLQLEFRRRVEDAWNFSTWDQISEKESEYDIIRSGLISNYTSAAATTFLIAHD